MVFRATSLVERRDVDDLAALPRDHPLGDRAADDEDAGQIVLHHFFEGRLAHFDQRLPALDAGIVDQNVDRPDFALDPGDALDHRRLGGHVEGIALGL